MQLKFKQPSIPALRDVPNLVVWLGLGLAVLYSVPGLLGAFWGAPTTGGIVLGTAALLAVALVPSLPGLIRAAGLPEALKVELHEIKGPIEEFLAINEPVASNRQGVQPEFMAYNHDPNLALASFRIELERHIRNTAQRRGMRCDQTIHATLDALARVDALSYPSMEALEKIIVQADRAAHGADVDPAIAPLLVEQGEKVLATMEAKSK